MQGYDSHDPDKVAGLVVLIAAIRRDKGKEGKGEVVVVRYLEGGERKVGFIGRVRDEESCQADETLLLHLQERPPNQIEAVLNHHAYFPLLHPTSFTAGLRLTFLSNHIVATPHLYQSTKSSPPFK